MAAAESGAHSLRGISSQQLTTTKNKPQAGRPQTGTQRRRTGAAALPATGDTPTGGSASPQEGSEGARGSSTQVTSELLI